MTVWCQWFGAKCKHGFQRRRSNFDGKSVHFKGLKHINLLRNFRLKVGECWDWTNLRKSCKKLAWWSDEAAALKACLTCVLAGVVWYDITALMRLDSIALLRLFCCCRMLLQTWICRAPCREHTHKALRYGTRSQGNHICLCIEAFSLRTFFFFWFAFLCFSSYCLASRYPNMKTTSFV